MNRELVFPDGNGGRGAIFFRKSGKTTCLRQCYLPGNKVISSLDHHWCPVLYCSLSCSLSGFCIVILGTHGDYDGVFKLRLSLFEREKNLENIVFNTRSVCQTTRV